MFISPTTRIRACKQILSAASLGVTLGHDAFRKGLLIIYPLSDWSSINRTSPVWREGEISPPVSLRRQSNQTIVNTVFWRQPCIVSPLLPEIV